METIVSKDGTRIAFERSGHGAPLVLVHGTSADHSRWAPVIQAFSERYTVYAIDRRGRGGSGDSQPYEIEREFEDVAAVVDSIVEPVNLLGHSWGALCSLGAARLTSNLKSLILYEPPPPGVKGFVDSTVFARLQLFLEDGDREGLVSTFLLELAGVIPTELDRLKQSPAWSARIAAAHTILRENVDPLPPFDTQTFANLVIPTLLILGGDSNHFFADFIYQINETFPNSKVVVLPGQRHVAINTAPELFASTVLEFLNHVEKQEG